VSTVLVTGGSGFIGSHAILQLLAAGHSVRTTVRDLKRESEVRATVQDTSDRLSFFAADLEKDAGWREAITGCDYVLHVASPFPAGKPQHEDELIVPAREGALRVLRAARDAGVKRVVLTSSFAAVGYGHPLQQAPFDETSWSDINSSEATPYIKSKTLAERAAWDFMAREGGALELSVINPVGVFGPVLSADFATSIILVQRMLNGTMPFCPRLYFGVVDVRDVAELHIRAMTHPAARGERFLAVAGETLSVLQIAQLLRRTLTPAAASRIPTRELPNWLVRLIGRFNPALGQLAPQLGRIRRSTNNKARGLLGWSPRSNEEALVATAESLARLTSQ
jgi:nucleoside-diphosphate-sugar epimerase